MSESQKGIHPTAYIDPTAIVESGASIGPGSKVWHHCHVRKGACIGANCVLGKNVFVDVDVHIGDRVKIQNNVSVYHGVTIENDVFVGPAAVFTNDRFPRAFEPWNTERAARTLVRNGASICAGACIRCGITIGEYAMIGMGAVQTKDAGDYELWLGNPASCQGLVDKAGKPSNKNIVALTKDLQKLESKRLSLRKFSETDAESIYEYASDPEISRYTTWDAHASLDVSRGYLQYVLDGYSRGRSFTWAIIHKDMSAFIGAISLEHWNAEDESLELGYVLKRDQWGQGFVTEAVSVVLDFAFGVANAKRVFARCVQCNLASERVMQKVGMVPVGGPTLSVCKPGSEVYVLTYEMLR